MTYLKRILVVARDANVTFHNLDTFDPGEFNRALQGALFLWEGKAHPI